jgi:hypothetical protein
VGEGCGKTPHSLPLAQSLFTSSSTIGREDAVNISMGHALSYQGPFGVLALRSTVISIISIMMFRANDCGDPSVCCAANPAFNTIKELTKQVN